MSQPTTLNDIQSVFLGQIRDRLSENVALADEMAELLNVSRDSAYRRIRGETMLSLDEVKKLYDQYRVSVDAIISPASNMVLIHHQAVDFNYSLEEWLKSLIQNLELAKSSKNPELTFAAKDIPIFHYFRYPTLSSFKLFVWLKSVIKDPRFENLSYKPDVLPKEILAGVEKAWQLYASLPSTEIWSDEVINGTLKQIEFYRECDYFTDRNTAGQLYDQMLEFINLIREEASAGKKSEGGSFKLYQNEIFIPDNTILANINNQRIVYINYNTTDLLTTQQGPFCEKTEAFMINLIKNSALISATAEKERNKFFNNLESRILVSKSKTSF